MSSPQRGKASLLDLCVVLIVVVLGAALFLPMIAKRHSRSGRIGCANNLKQVTLSFRLWAGDNGDKLPAQVSTNEGGAMELVSSGLAFPHFAVMSNELGTPKIVACPADASRTFAPDFASLCNSNVSYFAVPEADETHPQLWISGDRNLATNTVALKPGLFTMPTNHVMSWTAQIHQHQGYVALSDGSVQQYSSTRLQQSGTNALRAYYGATTNMAFRLLIP